MTSILQVVAEPRRNEILRIVWEDERSAGDIARHFDVTFGAVSQHLKVLLEAGLVDVRRVGKQRFYRANRGNLGELAGYIEQQWRDRLNKLKSLVEAEENKRG